MLYIIKFLYQFALPPGLFILVLMVFALWLSRCDRKMTLIALLILFGFYLSSSPLFSNLLIHSLEQQYRPPKNPNGDVIIMLGQGATLDTPDINGMGELSGNGANGLITTARLQRITGLPVILSGGQVFSNSGPEAEIAQRQLIELGIHPDKIFIDSASLNTAENAMNVKSIMESKGYKNPILITSAFHMPRAIMNFNKVHISVHPFPTNYLTNSHFVFSFFDLAPNYQALSNTGVAFKEYLGILALKFGITL